MCGINGYFGADGSAIERMNVATSHRGPDGTGTYSDGIITLGHNRLAIVDVSERGHQPMLSNNGAIVVTYNGEIYNFKELKRELASYPYRSETDTEVLIAAYKQWGVDFIKRLNGIFAFALWDKERQQLLLARDPMGVKPLYYTIVNGFLVFSSELKGIREFSGSGTINTNTLTQLLHLGDPIGHETMIENIFQLRPGHYALWEEHKLIEQPYWSAPKGADISWLSRAESISRLRTTIDQAVERQLVSDRPVGISLSGGIDSSSILATATKLQHSMRTYTTRFSSGTKDLGRSNVDADIAKRTAQHFGSVHTEVILNEADTISLFERSVWHLDHPTSSATSLSRLALAEVASRDVKVLLGGEGGDELFGGYVRYQIHATMALYQKLPLSLRTLIEPMNSRLAKLNIQPGIKQFELFYSYPRPLISGLLGKHYKEGVIQALYENSLAATPDTHPLQALMEVDRRMLSGGSLMQTDKLFMAAGLEGRVPLLDQELLELSYKIPVHYKANLLQTKIILKQAMRDRLPEYLFKEKKRGWVSPGGAWLKSPTVEAYVRSVLSPGYCAQTRELFDWEQIDKFTNSFYNNNAPAPLLWALLGFQVWAHQWYTK